MRPSYLYNVNPYTWKDGLYIKRGPMPSKGYNHHISGSETTVGSQPISSITQHYLFMNEDGSPGWNDPAPH